MLRKVRSFSNLLKASILSFSVLMVLSGVCYGQTGPNNQTTILISRPDGTPTSTRFFRGGVNAAVSGDGRTISYTATSNTQPAIVADRLAGNLEAISRGNNNRLEQGQSTSLSADGGIIAFQSTSRDLLGQQQATGQSNVYFNIRNTDGVTLVSTRMGSSSPSNGRSISPAVSGDGSLITYVSNSTDISTDSQTTDSIYVYDRRNGISSLISKTDTTFLQNCSSPAISRDGSVVAFISSGRIFVKRTGTDFAQQITTMANQIPSSLIISSDGTTLAYISSGSGSPNVVVDSINGNQDFVIRVNPFQSPNNLSKPIALSGNGRFLAVATLDQLSQLDMNNFSDVYVYTVPGGNPALISLDSNGNIANSDCFDPALNEDGAVAAFASNGQLTPDADISPSNIFAVVGAGNGAGGAGSIVLGPVCVAGGRALAPDTVEIAWGFPNSHNEQLRGFKVEVARLEGSEYRSIAKVPADGKAIYVDTSLKPKTKYTYRLWVENPKGYAYSVDFSVKTPKAKK